MELENYLLIIALLFVLTDLMLIRKQKVAVKRSVQGFYVSFIGFCTILLVYFSFIADFVRSDFSVKQVYSYSMSSMPTVSKLYATWAGSAGSILLLVLFISIAWFSIRAYGYRRTNAKNLSTSLILGIVLTFFLVATLFMNPFSRYGLDGPIEGRGLNPVLQSFWMAIHPPVVFAGYAFVVLAFALTMAKMRTGLPNYERLLNFSVRAAWLFLTLGIGLGGLWAYEVLGWGGYWSWDPIETASLLPWIALTVYFLVHSSIGSGKNIAGEFAILIAFTSLMFLSALTRGGLLQSVHAYGLSPAGPFILLFAGAMIVYFFYLKRGMAKSLFSFNFPKRLSLVGLSFIAIASLAGIFVVCLSGIVYSMLIGLINSNAVVPGVSFYNYANFPFVVVLILELMGISLEQRVTWKSYIALITATFVLGTILAIVSLPTNNVLANIGLPFAVAAILTGFLRVAGGIKMRSSLLVRSGLIHLGLVVILLGVFISATSKETTIINNITLDSMHEASSLTLKINGCAVYTDNNSIELTQGTFPQSSYLLIDVIVLDGQKTYGTQLSAFLYPAYGAVSKPTIIRAGFDDIYLHLNMTEGVINSLLGSLVGNSTEPKEFTITMERIPMANVVWVGVAILVIGGIMSTVSAVKYPNYPKQHRFS